MVYLSWAQLRGRCKSMALEGGEANKHEAKGQKWRRMKMQGRYRIQFAL